MPLRDDLLDPIEGDNPSGPDLRYDPVFDQIKEARREDDASMPAGDWVRTVKKAEYPLIVKLAGQALAKRSKDLRLAGSLIEAVFKLEGLNMLVPSLELLRMLQTSFWSTLHPEAEDGDVELRAVVIERLAKQMATIADELPITRSGFTLADYLESRTVGYEVAATTSERMNSRQAAIDAKQLTAEEFDKNAIATPKAFFVDSKASLDQALEQLQRLDLYHRDCYGEQYPQLKPLSNALEKVLGVIEALLTDRLKSEPDLVSTTGSVEYYLSDPPPISLSADVERDQAFEWIPAPVAMGPVSGIGSIAEGKPLELYGIEEAYAQVVRSAQFLFDLDQQSPVPYLVCAALRLGETRSQPAEPESDFAYSPSSATRQHLRTLAVAGSWSELLSATLPVLAEPCARAWLDLHRYIWRAAKESGYSAIASAVVGTVRALLAERPEVRQWTLDDDTAAANPETQTWLDCEVLPPVLEPAVPLPPTFEPSVAMRSNLDDESADAESVYAVAMKLLESGRPNEGIAMMVREAQIQPSGRMRFRCRLQLAQMCVEVGKSDFARTVLEDLAQEIERRHLETWEAGEDLAAPLSLLLKCLESRQEGKDLREAVFARLCLLDPNAALAVNL